MLNFIQVLSNTIHIQISTESEKKKFVFWKLRLCVKLKLVSLKMAEMSKICHDYYTDEKVFCDRFGQNAIQTSGSDSSRKCAENECRFLL